MEHDPSRGLLSALVADGRPLIKLGAVVLALCGIFALFLSATGHFLPHDVAYLGMAAEELCAVQGCRVVHFMFHDRVSFGGTLLAIAVLYLWLAEFPLRAGEAWAWWLLLVSGVVGFGSFLAYLGYGYLDTWHGVATLLLLPCFGWGLARSWHTLPQLRTAGAHALLTPGFSPRVAPWRSAFGFGRWCLLGAAAGMIASGLTIMVVGMTVVFVPQDIAYMGVSAADLRGLNERLVPLIAHDRSGFGGGVCTAGLLILGCVWCGRPSRGLWHALAAAGAAGFATAIGVHPLIGYNDAMHLAPAVLGAVVYALGLALTRRGMRHGLPTPAPDEPAKHLERVAAYIPRYPGSGTDG